MYVAGGWTTCGSCVGRGYHTTADTDRGPASGQSRYTPLKAVLDRLLEKVPPQVHHALGAVLAIFFALIAYMSTRGSLIVTALAGIGGYLLGYRLLFIVTVILDQMLAMALAILGMSVFVALGGVILVGMIFVIIMLTRR